MNHSAGHKRDCDEDALLLLCRWLGRLRWPDVAIGNEVSFNRDALAPILRSTKGLADIEIVDQSKLRLSSALPFFGWGAYTDSNRSEKIHGKVRTDLTFTKGQCTFFVENKIVQNGRECDIKNALVQAVEYLNLYTVALGIVLIFDDGRGRNRAWRGHPEEGLIEVLTCAYPICVVRVCPNRSTETYYDPKRITNCGVCGYTEIR